MRHKKDPKQLAKLLNYALGRDPDEFGLVPDESGFIKIKELLKALHEEDGWKLLYLVEDDAVENGVWTSLHLEEGNLAQVINHYIESYGIDTMLVKRKDEFKRMFAACSIPIIGL